MRDRRSMKVRIRRLNANSRYVPQYVALRNRYTEHLLSHNVDVEETRQWLGLRCVWIAVQGGSVLGAAWIDASRADQLSIVCAQPGQGVGTLLMDFVEKEAKKYGRRSLSVAVSDRNPPALAFFLSRGYIVPHGRFLLAKDL